MYSLLNQQAFAFDRPILYKDLLVYPVKMENYYTFHFLIRCLLLEKNMTLEGISKTYLEYLYSLKGDESKNLAYFDALLKMCLRKDSLAIKYGYKGNRAIFQIEEKEYTSEDFDELRLLICEQNDVELPDETIQKEIRDSMEEVKRLRARMSGGVQPTLEDQIVCVMVSTSLKPEDIANISIRKFGQILQRADAKLHYQVYLAASLGGTEFKDKTALKHWMSGNEKNKWNDTMISIEALKGKLGDKTQDNKK